VSGINRPTPPSASASPRRARPALSPVQRIVSGGLVTVIGANTLAPVWAPALIPQPETVARDVVENLLQRSASTTSTTSTTTTTTHNAVSLRAAQLAGELSTQSRDARAIFADVDARLGAVDGALGVSDGTTRAAAVERALRTAGVDPVLAGAVAHGTARAAQASRGVQAIEEAVRSGRLDPAVLLLGGASLLDRLSSDVRLETAFVIGFALAPHLSTSARVVAETAVHAGQGVMQAAHRHRTAIEHLKHPGTGNAIIDGAGFVAGSAADVVASGLAFFGPGPVLGLMRGGEPALVLAQWLAAKTAIAGTEKTLATYTSVPEDAAALMAGFLAGAASHASVDDAKAEALATVAHVRTSAHALHDAVEAGDLRAVHGALHDAVSTATPAEQALWAHVLQSVIEHSVGGAA